MLVLWWDILESKYYRLFDPIKQQIVIKRNVIFGEKYSYFKLLNSSFGLLHYDPFEIIFNTGSTIPLLHVLTSSSTSLLELTGSWPILSETLTSPDQPYKSNDDTLTPYLPWWAINTCELVGSNVVISPPVDILVVKSNMLMLFWWLVFLRLVILTLMKMLNDNLSGSRPCWQKWILFSRITLGILFFHYKGIMLLNIDGFIKPSLPLKVLLSSIRLIFSRKDSFSRKALTTLRPFPRL